MGGKIQAESHSEGKKGLLDFNLMGISTPVGKNCKNNISELWKGWCDSDKIVWRPNSIDP